MNTTNEQVAAQIATPNIRILKKIHAVMCDVNYIQKDKRNTFHNYTYASEAAIKEALHAAFVKNGIVFLFEVVETSYHIVKTAKGAEETQYMVRCEWSLRDIDTAEEVCGRSYGVGQDAGDKGIYKAITGAIKYMLTANFLIPTGDDPEEQQAQAPAAAKQDSKELNAKARETKKKNEIKTLLTDLGYSPKTKEEWEEKIKALTDCDLIAENYDEIIDKLTILKKESMV